MNVLVSAYACLPGEGSEPGMGWNWGKQIARFHRAWIVTLPANRPRIEAALAAEPIAQIEFVYFDIPLAALCRRMGTRFHYYLWHLAVHRLGRRLHRQVGFDLVHHTTHGTYWMPNLLALLPMPFVWGPIGGGESAPRTFRSSFGWRGRLYELLRDVARWRGERDPLVRLTARRARISLATTPQTQERLSALGCSRIAEFSHVGLPADEMDRLSTFPSRHEGPFRLLSIGRLIHWKGYHLAVEAFARFHLKCPESEYWLLCDGAERRRLERQVKRLDLEGKVKFWGWLGRWGALEKLADVDVLIHPAVHESGGTVCLEAMAAGRPVVCLDLGGPRQIVDEESGIRVRASTPAQVVEDLSRALLELASNRDRCRELGENARQRVALRFHWDRRGEDLMRLYQSLG